MFTFLLWLILLIICWPLALLALILYPLVWADTLAFSHPWHRLRGRLRAAQSHNLVTCARASIQWNLNVDKQTHYLYITVKSFDLGGSMHRFILRTLGSIRFFPSLAILLFAVSGSITPVLALQLDYACTFLWQGVDQVVVKDNIAYCLNPQGIRALDVSEPATPVELATLHWDCPPLLIKVQGDLLFIIDNDDQLSIVKVMDDWSLERIGSVKLDAWIPAIEVNGNFVYVLEGNAGDGFFLTLVDVSYPATPQKVGRIVVGHGGNALKIWQHHIYVALGYGDECQLKAFDITNTPWPTYMGETPELGEVLDIAVRNDTVFACGPSPDLQIWDFTEASEPRQVCRLNTPSRPAQIEIIGNIVLLGDYTKTFRTLDVTNPEAPSISGVFNSVGSYRCLTVSDNKAYMTNGRVLKSISFAEPNQPKWEVDLDVHGYPKDLEVNAEMLFVAHGDSGLVAFDISDISRPEYIWTWSAAVYDSQRSGADRVTSMANRLYSSLDDGTLKVFELTQLSAPTLVAQHGGEWNGTIDGQLNGDTLFMTLEEGSVIIADFRDPAAPVQLSNICGPGKKLLDADQHTSIVSKPNWKFSEDFELYNTNNQLQSTLLSSYSDFPEDCYWENPPGGEPGFTCSPTGPEDAILFDSIVAVNSPTGGLMLFDIADRENPIRVFIQDNAMYPHAGYFGKLAFQDNLVFASRPTSVEIYDVSNPESPGQVSVLRLNDYVNDFVLASNALFIATNSGIITYQIGQTVDVKNDDHTIPSVFSIFQNSPNPFNASTVIDYSVERHSQILIEVLNILGQKVRTLVNSSMPPGRYRVEWDGDDQSGNTVSSGVYLYRIKSNESEQTRKMLLLK